MNRRSFISGLIRVGAFPAFNPNRVIFDMGRKLWVPQRYFYNGHVYDGREFITVRDIYRRTGNQFILLGRQIGDRFEPAEPISFSFTLSDPLEFPQGWVEPKPQS